MIFFFFFLLSLFLSFSQSALIIIVIAKISFDARRTTYIHTYMCIFKKRCSSKRAHVGKIHGKSLFSFSLFSLDYNNDNFIRSIDRSINRKREVRWKGHGRKFRALFDRERTFSILFPRFPFLLPVCVRFKYNYVCVYIFICMCLLCV